MNHAFCVRCQRFSHEEEPTDPTVIYRLMETAERKKSNQGAERESTRGVLCESAFGWPPLALTSCLIVMEVNLRSEPAAWITVF